MLVKPLTGFDLILFTELSKSISGVTLRLFIVCYAGQTAGILWAGIMSDVLHVCNGVRQGGGLYPRLCKFYINELSVLLNVTYAGYCLGRSINNHLLYVDDVVLFVPSAIKGLQKLLDV
jgi:hypothetical protein